MRLLFVLLLFFGTSLHAQEYAAVDSKVTNYGPMASAAMLAAKIKTDFASDHDRVRAAFRWTTENIRYDLAAYYAPTTKKISFSYRNEAEKQERIQAHKDALIATVFSSRKSVCEGYAQTFKKLCDLLGIRAVVIKGYARNNGNAIGTLPTGSNHAWNAVYLDAEWKLLDATWAAGYEFNGQWKKQFTPYFYFPQPAVLLQSHFPENAQWQLVQEPVSKKDFSLQPLIDIGFFAKNLTLLTPHTGILPPKLIDFQIKGLTKDHVVGYLLKGQKYGTRVPVRIKNGIGSFSIALNGKKQDALSIFIDSELVLEYKIQ